MKNNPFYQSILVPVDYTPEAELAIGHACAWAKKTGQKLVLLRIEDTLDKQKVDKVHETLDSWIETHVAPHQLTAYSMVREGDFLELIAATAQENQSHSVFMATHGVRGWQHVRGSNAIKIIRQGHTPFFIFQGQETKIRPYRNILLPVDFKSETKQKFTWAPALCQLFSSHIHVLVEHETDEFIINKVNNNLAFVERYLEQNQVPFTIHRLNESGNFSEQTVDFAHSIQADLIIIMVEPARDLLAWFTGDEEQVIISNQYNIPVLCMNPVDTTIVAGPAMFQV